LETAARRSSISHLRGHAALKHWQPPLFTIKDKTKKNSHQIMIRYKSNKKRTTTVMT